MVKHVQKMDREIPLYGTVDERTLSIVYQGDAYMGRFLIFAILIDVVLRSFAQNVPFIEQNWDLMTLAIVGGLISTYYQIKFKVIFNQQRTKSLIYVVSAMGLCALLAFIIVFISSWR